MEVVVDDTGKGIVFFLENFLFLDYIVKILKVINIFVRIETELMNDVETLGQFLKILKVFIFLYFCYCLIVLY